MSSFLQDLRHSIRQLRRRPLFTLTAVLSLAIGMGVNAVAFTVVNGLLFRGSARSTASGTGRIATTPAALALSSPPGVVAMRRWLVGAQIAGSTVFLASAALFAQSQSNARSSSSRPSDLRCVRRVDPIAALKAD